MRASFDLDRRQLWAWMFHKYVDRLPYASIRIRRHAVAPKSFVSRKAGGAVASMDGADTVDLNDISELWEIVESEFDSEAEVETDPDPDSDSEAESEAGSEAEAEAEVEAAVEASRNAEKSSPPASGRRAKEVSLHEQEHIERHLELGIATLCAIVTPVVVMPTLAFRVDGNGDRRPSRTGCFFEEFVEIFDFPLLPAEFVPHLPDGTADYVPERLVRAVAAALLKYKTIFREGAHAVVTAGEVAQRVWSIFAQENGTEIPPHVHYPCKWRQSCGTTVYYTLCGASAVFESRVSLGAWQERVQAAFRRYAAIQWSLLPEERKAELAAAKKAWWADLPEGRRAEIAENISQACAARSDEYKAEIKAKMKQTCAARPEEVKTALSGKMSTIVTNHWLSLSPEQKAHRLKNFRAACPSSSKRSDMSRAWWEKKDAAEREAFMQPLRKGYKAKMTPDRQAEVGRKRAAHYDEHPEKRVKARDNALRNLDQCIENFSHRGTLTDTQLKQRAETLSQTNRTRFVADINEKFEKLQEGHRLSHRERHVLRGSWNRWFKKAGLGPEVEERYKQLVMSDTDFAKSSGALGVLTPSARVFVELIERRFREVKEGTGAPMTGSEARTLRKRMKRTFQNTDLGPGVREKYEFLRSAKAA